MRILLLILLCLSSLATVVPSAKAYLDPETGTFITLDPSGFRDGPNLYTYVGNNPWSKCDPYGLEAVAFLRYEEDYKRALELQKEGNALWRKDVHIVFFPDEDGQSHPVFEGLKLGGFSGEYAGKMYDKGSPFLGTRAAWYFGDERHSKIVNDWFASGKTLELLTIGASTAVGSRIPGPASVPEVVAVPIAARAAAKTAETTAAVGTMTQIPYGGNDLSHMVIAMRYAEQNFGKANAAVIEYRAADGTLQYLATFSSRTMGHSEKLLASSLLDAGVEFSQVTRLYTELEPCALYFANCKKFILTHMPQADVTFSFEYGTLQISRDTGRKAMGEAIDLLQDTAPPAPSWMNH